MLDVVTKRKNFGLEGFNAVVRGFVCGTLGFLTEVYVVLKRFVFVEGNGEVIENEESVLDN